MLRSSTCAGAAPKTQPIALVVALAAALASPTAARAQLRAPALPALAFARGKLVPGAWVRYAVVNAGASQAVLVYIAALERKGSAQWFEMAITGGQRRTLLMRTLVGGLSAKRPGKLKVLAAIVQPPGQRALLLPTDVAARQKPPVQAASRLGHRGGSATVKRGERVHVPGGTFTTTHFHRKVGGRDEHTWMSSKLGAWPLVKYELGTLSIELMAHGSGAHSRIQGKPIKLDKRLLKQLGGAP